jgi:hypothetical protein
VFVVPAAFVTTITGRVARLVNLTLLFASASANAGAALLQLMLLLQSCWGHGLHERDTVLRVLLVKRLCDRPTTW